MDDATHMRLSSVGASRGTRRAAADRLVSEGGHEHQAPGRAQLVVVGGDARPGSNPFEKRRSSSAKYSHAEPSARIGGFDAADLDHRRRQESLDLAHRLHQAIPRATGQFEEGSGRSSLRWSSSARSLTPPANAPSAPGGPAR